MTCKHCGIDIADKALICYKCGTATVEPRITPPARMKRKRGQPTMIVLLVIMLVALLVWLFSGLPPVQ